MNAQPITITATTVAWLYSGENPNHLLADLEGGKHLQAINRLAFWGAPNVERFGTYVRVGEAEITVRLIPKDEQVALAVSALNEKLEKARAAWLDMQREILADIQKLQAITYEAPAEVTA